MAARVQKELTDKWREKIRLSQIINRLDQCAVGEIEMTKNELKAADMLLKKLVPDLSRTELSGPDGGPVQHTVQTDRDMIAQFLTQPQEQK